MLQNYLALPTGHESGTRFREAAKIASRFSVPPSISATIRKNIQSGPEETARRSRGGVIHGRAPSRRCSVKYSKSISGDIYRGDWAGCVVTPTRFIIFQTCLFSPTPQGVTLSHRGDVETKCNEVVSENGRILSRLSGYLHSVVTHAPRDN